MAESLDVEAMLQRFRDRAQAVRNRPLPPVAGEERTRFIEQAQVDFQDFAIVGDATASMDDGVLVLRVDLRPSDRLVVSRRDDAIAAIDAANAADPNTIEVRGEVRPKEQAHAELMTEWLLRLDPDATDAQHLAARAHHLRRWSVPRSEYPDGRAGYLRWRTALKKQHADEVASILERGRLRRRPPSSERSASSARRASARIPQVQTHEDALCLVFLETQLAELVDAQGDDKMRDIIQKTVAKMSQRAVDLAGDLPMRDADRALIARALGGDGD